MNSSDRLTARFSQRYLVRGLLALGLGLVAVYQVGAWLSGIYTEGTLLRGSLAVAYLVGGAIAWARRPEYLTGRLMILIGFLVLVPSLQRLNGIGAVYALSSAFSTMYQAVLAYLILTYPSGRATSDLNGRMARLVVVLASVAGLADLLTRQTADAQCPVAVCTVEPNPFLILDLGTIAADISLAVTGLVAVAVLLLVVRRFLRAVGAARRVLAPVLLAGVLSAALIAVEVLAFATPMRPAVGFLAGSSQILIPVALAVGFLRSRMARAGVADLVLRAGRAPTLEGLESAVRGTLHDPSARLARWSETVSRYLGSDGAPLDTEPAATREITLISGSRGRLAALAHDPILAEEGELLPSVAAAVRIVLENEDLATSLHAQVADARSLPVGRVTLLATDVEGSTELLDALRGDYAVVISELRQMIRSHVRAAGGAEIDSRADEFFGVIPDAGAAISTAADIQREVAGHQWPGTSPVRIRIGLHTGEPNLTDDGYIGMDIHLTARISATGHGGQIVVSDATAMAVAGRLPSGYHLQKLGSYRLKGIPFEVDLHQLSAAGLGSVFPPLRA